MATRRSSTSRRQQQQQQHVPQQQQVPQQRNDLVVADADVDGLLAELNELDVGLFCVALGAAWYFAYRDERSMVACSLWTGLFVVGASLHFRRKRRRRRRPWPRRSPRQGLRRRRRWIS